MANINICPHCRKELDIPIVAFRNVETYHNSVISISRCCNAAFRVSGTMVFSINEYKGNETEDNWGNKIRKHNI